MTQHLVPATEQIRRLLADQAPALADAQIVELEGPGTTNAIVRIEPDHVARFPKTAGATDESRALEAELRAMSEFANASPVPAPRPVLLGRAPATATITPGAC